MSARGVGIYLRDHGAMKSPAVSARIAQDNSIDFVCLCASWQEPNGSEKPINTLKDLLRYADAFRSRDIDVWIWGYPWAGHEQKFIERMITASKVTGAKCWVLDPELPYKWKRPRDKAAKIENARALVTLTSAMKGSVDFGVTSFGMLTGHKNFPWTSFGGFGFGSPQLYTVTPEDVDRGLKAWSDYWSGPLVPSVPVYGERSGPELHDYLSGFVDSDVQIDGFIAWSWPQISPAEWKVLARWSDWFSRVPDLARS